MIPYIHVPHLHLAGFSLPPFLLLVLSGVVVGVVLALARGRKEGCPPGVLGSFIVAILLGGFIGSHVFEMVFYRPDELLKYPSSIFVLWAGMSSFGGFLGALVGALVFKYYESREILVFGPWALVAPQRRKRPIKILPLSDIILAVFPIAWTLGRAGCAVAHDHPGKRASTDNIFAVAYGPGPVGDFGLFELRYGVEPRFDLGLLEMLFALFLSIAFITTWKKGGARGWYVVSACVLYAPVRFGMDFLRIQDTASADLRYLFLTPAQWLTLLMLLFGLLLGRKIIVQPPTLICERINE